MKELNIKQIGISVEGEALINLWGGGQGTISMDRTFLPLDKATKTNILRCVNDGGFGCESIESAEIDIYDVYEHHIAKIYNRTIFTSCRHHTKYFLGWRELSEQGIKF